MSSTYGENLRLSIFGQSHGKAIGMTMDGIPAGLPVDLEKLQQFLNRRAPGQNDWSTPRKEADRPEILGGIYDGYTCGAPIAAVIHNTNTRSGDYDHLKDRPRPGHADYTANITYGGYQDAAGGGHFSGRLTAPLCITGGLCLQWLEAMGIRIGAHIANIHGIEDDPFDPVAPQFDLIYSIFIKRNLIILSFPVNNVFHSALGILVRGDYLCVFKQHQFSNCCSSSIVIIIYSTYVKNKWHFYFLYMPLHFF